MHRLEPSQIRQLSYNNITCTALQKKVLIHTLQCQSTMLFPKASCRQFDVGDERCPKKEEEAEEEGRPGAEKGPEDAC